MMPSEKQRDLIRIAIVTFGYIVSLLCLVYGFFADIESYAEGFIGTFGLALFLIMIPVQIVLFSKKENRSTYLVTFLLCGGPPFYFFVGIFDFLTVGLAGLTPGQSHNPELAILRFYDTVWISIGMLWTLIGTIVGITILIRNSRRKALAAKQGVDSRNVDTDTERASL